MKLKTNKKGAIETETIGKLILYITVGILLIGLVMMVVGFVFPALSGLGCGAMVWIRGMVPIGKEFVPLFTCNQYQEPVKLDVGKWSACPGINKTICEHPEKFETDSLKKKDILQECREQCGRIQIDKYADNCWQMGGTGDHQLSWMAPSIHILRCYRIQIIGMKHDEKFGDNTEGRTWLNTLETPLVEDIEKINAEFEEDFKDVKNKDGLIFADWSYSNKSDYISTHGNEEKLKSLLTNSLGGPGVNKKVNNADRKFFLDYTDAGPSQICYISYYETGEAVSLLWYEVTVKGGEHFVGRDCTGWIEGMTGGFRYFN